MQKRDFIAVISDMHLAPYDAGTERQQSEEDMPERRARHLDSVFGQLQQKPHPRAILFGGDNTNQPVSDPHYRQCGHEFMKRFESIAPCYAIPGNHDVGSTAGWYHHNPRELEQACRSFNLDWSDRWTLDVNGFRIIAINTQIGGSGLQREEKQNEWLKQQLRIPSENARIVFGHTPFYLENPGDDFADGSEQMCLKKEARKPFLDILNASPPEIVLTTHAHRFWLARQSSWDWIGVPATALGQDEMHAVPDHRLPPGDDHVGWLRLWLDTNGEWEVEHCYCDS